MLNLTPSIGFKLKFNHDIDGKFKWLYDEKYAWEDGDNLEVIHITTNHDGQVCYIVLNCQADVLTTVAITDLSFFDTRTDKQKAVDEAVPLIINLLPSAASDSENKIRIDAIEIAASGLYDLWCRQT